MMQIASASKIKILQKIALAAAVLAAIGWSAASLAARFAAERGSDTVQIAFSWDEAAAAAFANNYRMEDFLDRLKAAGAGAVIIEEETPMSLDVSGEAIYISRQDYFRLRLLDVVTTGSVLKADTLIFDDAASASYFSGILKSRYSMDVETRVIGSRRFVYFKSAGAMPAADLPIGFSVKKIRVLGRYGFKIALAPSGGGDLSWLLDIPADGVSALIFEPSRGFRMDSSIVSRMAARFRVVDFEFYPTAVVSVFPPAAVIRGHRISVAEKISLGASAEIARYERAARERGIRFFRLPIDDKASIDENLDVIKALSRRLKKSGIKLGPAPSSVSSMSAVMPLSGLRKAMAFCLALIFPALLAMFARLYLSGMKPAAAFAVFNAAVLAAALLTASLVSSADFLSGLDKPFGVRFLLVFSWLAVLPAVFDATEARDFARKDLKVYHAAVALTAIALVAVALWRSSNDSYAPGFELKIRAALERIFSVRPRWKEMLFGQPFIWLAFRRRNRVFLLLGAVSSVSVINTFLHSHTPLVVSLWRSAAGMFAGALVGVVADAVISVAGFKPYQDIHRPRQKSDNEKSAL